MGIIAGVATLMATAPLVAIYDGLAWLLPCAVAIAAVVVTAIAARRLRAPVWAQVLAMLGALTLILTWFFRSGDEIFGILPGRATVEHFGALLAQLPTDVREHTTPVPAIDSLMLVTVAGIGLVAVLVDVFAAATRRPALAGLPLLAVYSVPVAVSFDSVPMVLFAIGAAGYLWLLGADNVDRVRRFGRRFSGDGRDVDPWEPSPLAGAGRRLAVIGVLVAVAIPLAFPGGMSSGIADRFGPGLGPGGTGEGGGVGRVNLFAELYGQLNLDETVDLVQVTTDDPNPFYLRLATADQITDTGFEPSAPSGRALAQHLPAEPDPAPHAGVTYHEHQAEVEITADFHMQMAPTYAQLVDMDGLSDEWRYDPSQQIVYSTRHGARGQDYRLTYQRAEYDPDALRQAERLPAVHDIQADFTQVPELPEVRELLDDMIDDSAAPYDQVLAILEFFSRQNGFRYDLETGPETDAPAIADFLENRVGFCVQYATAMAWLVRSIDIPARVAFGFTRGTGAGDTRVLTNRNLHAWTEVYFDGFGWVPFDPTPSGPVVGSTSPQWAPNPDAPSDPDTADPGDGPTGDNPDDPGFDPGDEAGPQIDENGAVGGAAPPTGPTVPWWGLGAVLLTLALLVTPTTHRSVQRRRRLPRDAGEQPTAAPGVVVSTDATAAARHRAHQAWREVLDTMIDLSIPVDPSETPRATARRLAPYTAESPDAARALHLLGHLEERARYARAPLSPEGIRAAVSTLRRALAGQSATRVRIRAAVLPPSTLLRWRNAVGEAMVQVSRATTQMGEQLARISPRRLLRATR